MGAPVGVERDPVGQVDGRLDRLVLLETVFGDEASQIPRVDAARKVVPRGDGQEGSRVVDETRGVVEAGGLGHELAEASHAVR